MLKILLSHKLFLNFLRKSLYVFLLFPASLLSLTLDKTLETVLKHIENDYIKEVGGTELTEFAINGIMKELDPYCRYLNPQKFLHWRYQSLGEGGAIGIEVIAEKGGLRVVTTHHDTPASKIPIKPGDLITKIDGQVVPEKEGLEAALRFLGPVDSIVTVEILRHQKLLTVSLKRAMIQIPPVAWYTEQKIGYIRISLFDSRTESALKNALHQIKERLNESLQGIILDLRNNGGGTLDSAIEVSDAFLDKGDIVIVKGKGEKIIKCYKARPGDILQGIPMVVLLNGASASASEVVAGALQDRKRAQIVGVCSYGKGIGQKMIPLDEGGALFLTIEQYFTPNGRQIEGSGIQPDFVVPIKMRVSEENRKYKGEMQNEYQPGFSFSENENDKETIKNGAHFKEAPPFLEQDYQLRRAMDVLKTQCFLREAVIGEILPNLEKDYKFNREIDLLRARKVESFF